MENATPRPDTINTLRFGVDSAFAMLAGMQLEVFTPLQRGPMTAEQIAEAIGIVPTRLPLLLYALVAAGLLTEQGGRFANTPEAQHFLVKGAPAYMGSMHGMLSNNWGNILKTAESLRADIPQAHVDFSHSPPEELEALLRRLHPRTVATAHELVERYDFSSAMTVVDIGGGGGGLAITLTKLYPHIQATVVDLPSVTPITRKIVDEEGATAHVNVLSADAVSGSLPGAYDVAVMKSILQVLSSEDARQMLQNVGAAINPDGRIYIIGHILDNSRTAPPGAVEFNLLSTNIYTVGESYTEREYQEWLRSAGFDDIERASVTLSDGYGLMTARKQS